MTTTFVNDSQAADSPRLLPLRAVGDQQPLSALSDKELLDLTGSLPRSSRRRETALDLLVHRYGNLVRSCVRKYSRSPEPTEDLMQVGYVGLVKAINNFDPGHGFGLAAYAGPCISGELKRHFRDKRWQVHVTRSLQETVLAVRQATHQLSQQLGHMPTDSELARNLGIGDADIREARQAELALQPLSLDQPLHGYPGAASPWDFIGTDDLRLEQMLGMQAIATHWGELPRREQQVVLLYFYRSMTQAQIGVELGISQMHVSRLLARALGYLRPRLCGQAECGTA